VCVPLGLKKLGDFTVSEGHGYPLVLIIGSSGLLLVASHLFAVPVLVLWVWLGHGEQVPTLAPQRMNGKSSKNSFCWVSVVLKKKLPANNSQTGCEFTSSKNNPYLCINQCCVCKWFETYTPWKCKSHNEIYLHSV
jgi:hypothetical protein